MDPTQQMAQALLGMPQNQMQNQMQNPMMNQAGMAQNPMSQAGMLGTPPPRPTLPLQQFGSSPHGSIYVDPATGRTMVRGM